MQQKRLCQKEMTVKKQMTADFHFDTASVFMTLQRFRQAETRTGKHRHSPFRLLKHSIAALEAAR